MSDEERKPEFQWIPAKDLHIDPDATINQHLVNLIGATATGERQPDVRHVPVRNLVTREEDVVPEDLALVLAQPPPPPQAPVFVVEIGPRRYWAFDDTIAVRVWQKLSPDLMVAVDVLQTYESSADRSNR
jgi:hypothetical protein